jgi:hypothetical protein
MKTYLPARGLQQSGLYKCEHYLISRMNNFGNVGFLKSSLTWTAAALSFAAAAYGRKSPPDQAS